MNILTLQQASPQSHELRFQPLMSGDIEVIGRPIRSKSSQKITGREEFSGDETRLALIPKSQRAAVAHYLVTGEVMP